MQNSFDLQFKLSQKDKNIFKDFFKQTQGISQKKYQRSFQKLNNIFPFDYKPHMTPLKNYTKIPYDPKSNRKSSLVFSTPQKS